MTADETARLEKLREKDIHSMSEIGEKVELENKVLKEAIDNETHTWGNWKFSPGEPPVLVHDGHYEIDLPRIDTVAKLGDWLVHLNDKSYITADDLGNLVKAVMDLHHIGYHKMSGRGCA